MEATSPNTPKDFVYDPFKRYLEGWVDWHDHANQWDVSEVWESPQPAPKPDYTRREPPVTGTEY